MTRRRILPVKHTHPLPLHHSWPLSEYDTRFDLGALVTPEATRGINTSAVEHHPRTPDGIGRWECDLADGALTWSAAVHDVFGLPRDIRPSRVETVALYAEHSRAAMERLRAYAIKHRRGFTLDAEIRPDRQDRRWMRLIAAPICRDGVVVRLHGLKLDVSHRYR